MYGCSGPAGRWRQCSSTTPAEDSLPAAEPAPRLIRFTQQDPGIGSGFGVLIICAGSGVTARIGTISSVYGALGFHPRFSGSRKVYRAADVNRTTGWSGT